MIKEVGYGAKELMVLNLKGQVVHGRSRETKALVLEGGVKADLHSRVLFCWECLEEL